MESDIIHRLTFSGDECKFEADDGPDSKELVKATFKLDVSKTPRWIDILIKKDGNPVEVNECEIHCIYSVDGDDLQISVREEEDVRPDAFETHADDRAGRLTFHFKREKLPPRELEPLKKEANARKEAPQKADGQKLRSAVPKKETSQSQKEKNQTVTYPVADVVSPIPGLDGHGFAGASSPNKKEDEPGTKEEWLINKITRMVSSTSWKGLGGTGTIDYDSRSMSLVVKNTARVQAQVEYLLETMRRVQDVQVATETRIISLNAGTFVKLQRLLPHMTKDRHVVLNELEMIGLLREAQDDRATTVMHAPKITSFPGQRVGICTKPIEETPKKLPNPTEIDLKFTAQVAVDLQHIDLDVKATIGKVEFTKMVRMLEGSTLAQFKRDGDNCLIFLITPRVILGIQETNPPAAKGDNEPE